MRRLLAIGVGTALACLAIAPARATAQSGSGNSGFVGVVKDESGAVLPGVSVEAASPALIEKARTAVTDEQGQYKFIDLRPGMYSVTFTLQGFSGVKQEQIELTPNFTATLNVEMTVGAVEETLTVTGQVSVVDVRNVVQQAAISRTQIDALPGNREILAYASMIPAVITPTVSQDVGGSKGEVSVRMAIHGGKQTDQKLMLDGMRYNSMNGNGTSRGFYVNPAATAETVIEMAAGGSAEYSTGGVQVNLLPRDGGNRFNGYFFVNNASGDWQAENLTDELRGRGLTTSNPVDNIYDINGGIGGPVLRDKLWFYSAHRYWGGTSQVANLFHNATVGTLLYTADPNRPVYSEEEHHSNTLRLTSQLSSKNRLNLHVDNQVNCTCNNSGSGTLNSGTVSVESSTAFKYRPNTLYQATWTYTHSNNILFEAGATRLDFHYTNFFHDGATEDTIPVVEQTKGFTYNGPLTSGRTHSGHYNERFAMTLLKGAHSFKLGVFSMQGAMNQTTRRNSSETSYTFSNQRPLTLTQYASPIVTNNRMLPELGIYGQDQWTHKRMTLNLGLRFEYIHSYVPASEQPAGRFLPARHFDEVDCVPCWKDISPRAGVAYDLFGTGKTAVKMSIGRYVAAQTVGLAGTFNPVNASVNNVNRPWDDTNFNFIPDCNLNDPALNGECGPLANSNFGKLNITTNPDPDLVNGWGKRDYNWQITAIVQHQLTPELSVSGGYFRTWYGNFTVTDNLEVTPVDFDHYCVTAPPDPLLPGGGNYEICGLYDVSPTKFGKFNNLLTAASNFGDYTEVYNGVDLNFVSRWKNGTQLSGGFNIGNSISGSGNATNSSTNTCFVVDSPQQLYQCDAPVPYQTRFKANVVHQLPWDVLVSANFQTLPGAPVSAAWAVPTALILPSLGRNLSGNTRSATVQLIAPFSQFEKRINQLDVRVAKDVRIRGGVRLRGMVDVYNILNSSAVLSVNTTYGPSYLQPTQIMDARLFKLGAQLDF